MAILDFIKPDKVIMLDSSNKHGVFEFRPLEPGYGITVGNAIRRVLIGSLEGYAICSIKINGIDHEFATIPGVITDVTNLILNLKQVRFARKEGMEVTEETIRMHVKGNTALLAGELNSYLQAFDVLNPELLLAEMDESADFEIEININKGRGYVSADENRQANDAIGVLAIIKFIKNTNNEQKAELDIVYGIVSVILGVIVIICMPIAALLGVFSGGIEIDTNRLQEMLQENQTVLVEGWSEVESGMTNAGYDATRIQEAQLLFVFSLYEHVEENGFADKFVGCFAAEQTDAELIANVNSAFGTDIAVEDFTKAMSATRNAYINTANYVDPTTKNNLDLVKWAENAADKGWGYVWGTYGSVLDNSLLDSKITQYPEEVGGKEQFIRENWLWKRTADCVGLIKGYSWYDAETQKTLLVSNGMPDIGADTMYENATEKGSIDTIPEILGLAVWKEGHIGIYIGNGKVVEAYGTTTGVIYSELADGGWSHWLKIPYITYMEQEVTE